MPKLRQWTLNNTSVSHKCAVSSLRSTEYQIAGSKPPTDKRSATPPLFRETGTFRQNVQQHRKSPFCLEVAVVESAEGGGGEGDLLGESKAFICSFALFPFPATRHPPPSDGTWHKGQWCRPGLCPGPISAAKPPMLHFVRRRGTTKATSTGMLLGPKPSPSTQDCIPGVKHSPYTTLNQAIAQALCVGGGLRASPSPPSWR